MFKPRSFLGLISVFSLFAQAMVQPAAASFDAIADCAAQPWGVTPGFVAYENQEEVLAELQATQEPEFTTAESIKDIFLQLAGPVLGDRAAEMNEAMTGLCLSKKDRTLHVSLYFKDVYTLELKPFNQAVKMETYRAVFPKVIRLSVEKYGKYVEIYLSGRYLSALRLKTKIPALSDWVYLHRLTLNTETHVMRIGAGALRDKVKVVAWSKFDPHAPLVSRIAFRATLGRFFRRGW